MWVGYRVVRGDLVEEATLILNHEGPGQANDKKWKKKSIPARKYSLQRP